MVLRTDPHIDNFSGIYPHKTDETKQGMADMGAGIGGWTYGAQFSGWTTRIAFDSNAHAVEAYKKLHPSTPCMQADMFHRSTLWHLADLGPLLLAIGFSCQPYSAAGYQQGFNDSRAGILRAIVIYTQVLSPLGVAMECVRGFTNTQNGMCLNTLKRAMGLISPSFRVEDGIMDLRDKRPIKRARWLGMALRQEDMSRIPDQQWRNLRNQHWTRKPSSLASFDIPRNSGLPFQELVLPTEIANVYLSREYLPQGYHSRWAEKWTAIPAVTHSMSNEMTPCPCGCRNQGLSDRHLKKLGIFSVVAKHHDKARWLHPVEIAQCMAFPYHTYWLQGNFKLNLALLGNSISPIHATVVLYKFEVYLNALMGTTSRHVNMDATVENLIQHCDSTWNTAFLRGGRGGIQHMEHHITSFPQGIRRGAFEITLITGPGRDHEIVIQVPSDILVSDFLQHTAHMLHTDPSTIAILHQEGDISSWGPSMGDISFLSDWDTLTVHSWITLNVYIRISGDRTSRRFPTRVMFSARTDMTWFTVAQRSLQEARAMAASQDGFSNYRISRLNIQEPGLDLDNMSWQMAHTLGPLPHSSRISMTIWLDHLPVQSTNPTHSEGPGDQPSPLNQPPQGEVSPTLTFQTEYIPHGTQTQVTPPLHTTATLNSRVRT